MRRALTTLRLRLPWWLFAATRPDPALRMDWWYLHGWGRRPAPARPVRTEPAPPVPTPVLMFPLRCQGALDCASCVAYDGGDRALIDESEVPLVEV